MRMYLECLPCLLRQAVEAVKMATDDSLKQREVVDAVLEEMRGASPSDRPPDIAVRVHRTVRQVSGCDDPYQELKQENNRTAMSLYPRAKQLITASDDPLRTAVALAIVGNMIDAGVGLSYDLDGALEDAPTREFAIDHFDRFRAQMARASTVLYLADNAGEIVFDRLLLEQMDSKNVSVAAKAEPMINDALVADARFARIDLLANIVALNGLYSREGLDVSSPETSEVFQSADLIVAKGQGNYEWLSDAKAPIFFLLMAKCPVIARDVGTEVGQMVVKAGEGSG
jgi:uncharacterized protein with ATP-grasp and redox domains